MTRLSALAVIVLSAIALGYAARAVAIPWRRTLVMKRLEQPAPTSLAGLATVQLAPSFKPIGRGTSSARLGGFDPATLDQHRNERQITFRFEQGQHQNMGGYYEDPVLLNITLYNPALPPPDTKQITSTTIARFYPPIDEDRPRFEAHFNAQQWLPDVINGASVTRAAATNEGRGDNVVSGPPERWLVIHVDPVRRVRVDLYAWRKAYSIDEARALVKRVAESVRPTPKLQELFDNVKTVDDRMAVRHSATVADAIGRLNACGITALEPGGMAWSGGCAAWFSPSRRDLHVARPIGRVPLAAATRQPREAPAFRVTPLPGKPAELIGPPDFQVLMFYWDDASAPWSIEGLGQRLYDDEPRESPLVAAIGERLADRASVYLVSLARYDLQFHPKRFAIEAFVSESDRVAAALRTGKLIPGVAAAPMVFEP